MAAYTLQGKTESGDVVDIPLAATCDANGKVISDTYATKTEVNAKATTAALNEVKNTATNAASTANEAKTAADKAITGFDKPSFKFEELPAGSQPTGSATITGDNSAKKFNFTFGLPASGGGGGGTYILPAASSSVLGGIKTGYSENGKNYPVKTNSDNQAYVYVPWESSGSSSDLRGFLSFSIVHVLLGDDSEGVENIHINGYLVFLASSEFADFLKDVARDTPEEFLPTIQYPGNAGVGDECVGGPQIFGSYELESTYSIICPVWGWIEDFGTVYGFIPNQGFLTDTGIKMYDYSLKSLLVTRTDDLVDIR